MGETNAHHDHGGADKQKRGISSYEMHDSELAFNEMNLKSGDRFLDLGCGAGDYSIRACEIVGKTGMVYALDRWEEVAAIVAEKAAAKKFGNVKAMVCNISGSLPIEDNSVDVCLMANVLHGFKLATDGEALFGKIRRVLKPGGRVAIIEFKKEETSFGPPVHIRISPEDIEKAITQHGFEPAGRADLGCNYLAQFIAKDPF